MRGGGSSEGRGPRGRRRRSYLKRRRRGHSHPRSLRSLFLVTRFLYFGCRLDMNHVLRLTLDLWQACCATLSDEALAFESRPVNQATLSTPSSLTTCINAKVFFLPVTRLPTTLLLYLRLVRQRRSSGLSPAFPRLNSVRPTSPAPSDAVCSTAELFKHSLPLRRRSPSLVTDDYRPDHPISESWGRVGRRRGGAGGRRREVFDDHLGRRRCERRL